VHAGEIYCGRDPRPLLDALRMLESARPASEPPTRLRLLGQLSEDNRAALARAARERGLGDVLELVGQVPYADALTARVPAAVLPRLAPPGRKPGVPAKLFESFGAARPILALAEPGGDLGWVLHASGMPHRVAPPRDVGAIFAALVALRDGLRGNRFELP